MAAVDVAGVVGTVALVEAVAVDGIVAVSVEVDGLAFVDLVNFCVCAVFFDGDNVSDNTEDDAEDNGDELKVVILMERVTEELKSSDVDDDINPVVSISVVISLVASSEI